MALDVCPSSNATYDEHLQAVNTTTKWAKQCMKYFCNKGPKYNFDQILSPIVQGGVSKELRKLSAEQLVELNAKMYAIGGLAVGEPKEEMLEIVSFLDGVMPKEKPRYLMGVGTPADLIECIALGIDMFDCVIPTRNGRNGQLFTYDGKINIRNSKFKNDNSSIDSKNKSSISKGYTKAYLHHLFKTEEILGYRIATQHNLSFYNNIIQDSHQAILKDNFYKWSKGFLLSYN
jgi:queuine tRNA-ribosyltransferase